jgi:hypothetical protein
MILMHSLTDLAAVGTGGLPFAGADLEDNTILIVAISGNLYTLDIEELCE